MDAIITIRAIFDDGKIHGHHKQEHGGVIELQRDYNKMPAVTA